MIRGFPFLAVLVAACGGGKEDPTAPAEAPAPPPDPVSTVHLVFSSRIDGELEACG